MLKFKKGRSCDVSQCVIPQKEYQGGMKLSSVMRRAIAVFLGTVELEYPVPDPSSPPPMITENLARGSLVDTRRRKKDPFIKRGEFIVEYIGYEHGRYFAVCMQMFEATHPFINQIFVWHELSPEFQKAVKPHQSEKEQEQVEVQSAVQAGASGRKRKHNAIDVAFMSHALEEGVLDEVSGEEVLVEAFRKALRAREQEKEVKELLQERKALKEEEESLTTNFDFGDRYEEVIKRGQEIIAALKNITTGVPPTPGGASVTN